MCTPGVRKASDMARRPRPTRTTRTRPLKLELIERSVFHVTDREVARQVRLALKRGDIERLAELIDFLNIDGPTTTDVLEFQEVRR